MALTLGMIILVSILIHGGFYPTSFLLASIIMGTIALIGRKRRFDTCDWLLWGLVVLCLVASLVNGYASDSLAQAALPCACALFLMCYRTLSVLDRQKFLTVILLGSSLFAGVAILAFCGVIPLTGAVASRRLQFTFQYANAAGSWFAATAILAQDHKNNIVTKCTIPLITVLFLTQSVGAIGLYVCLQAVRLWQRRKEFIWPETVICHGIAAGFAAILYLSHGGFAVVATILLYTVGWRCTKILSVARQRRIHWLMLPLGAVGGVAVLFTRRAASSIRTFLERLLQILDGSCAIAANPLFGLGAGNWEHFYPFYQTAQYNSAVVHSGMVQIGVDAGILAVGLALVFVVFAWRQGKPKAAESLASVLLAVHSLFDFTMQFFPLAALFLAVLFANEENVQFKPSAKGIPITRMICLLPVVLCAYLLFGDMQYKQLAHQSQAQNWAEAEAQFQQYRHLFGQNRSARRLYVRALYHQKKSGKTIAETEDVLNLTDEELLIRARVLEQCGDSDDACRLLLDRLAMEPYHVILFEKTAQFLRESEVGASYFAAYNQLTEISNQNQSLLGTLKGDQVYIDTI